MEEMNDEMKGKVVEKEDEFGDEVSEWQPGRGIGVKVVALVGLGILVLGLVVGLVVVLVG